MNGIESHARARREHEHHHVGNRRWNSTFLSRNGGRGFDSRQRAYPGSLAAGTHWVMCLTCHDPHGTDNDTVGSIGGDTFVQPGLLRMQADLSNATDLYAEPLCAQCHN